MDIERTSKTKRVKKRSKIEIGFNLDEKERKGVWDAVLAVLERFNPFNLKIQRTVEEGVDEEVHTAKLSIDTSKEQPLRREELETAVRELSQPRLDANARRDEQRKLTKGEEPNAPLPLPPADVIALRHNLQALIKDAMKRGYTGFVLEPDLSKAMGNDPAEQEQDKLGEIEIKSRRTLGKNIKQLRNQNGMSMRDLAERAGLSPKTISAIESNKTRPKIKTVRSIARALGVDETQLRP